ncbi:MAG TPA: hypothetical protein VF398_09725 [bacterium]
MILAAVVCMKGLFAFSIASLSFDFKGSGFLIFVLAALCLAWTYFAYRTTTPPARLPLRLFLGSLRAIALLLLIFLVFEPVISSRRQAVLKPLLALLVDDSQSMRNRDASGDRSDQLGKLINDPAWGVLQDRFDLKLFCAGDTLRSLDALRFDSLKLATVGTDLAGSWDELLSRDDVEGLSGIMLISDGGDNAGRDPLKSAEQIGVPIFTVGIGDTAAVRDASIASWITDPQAYRGKESLLTARLMARGLEGQAATLKLNLGDGRLIAEQNFKLPADKLETEIALRFIPDRAGSLPLYLTLSTDADEISEENNRRALILNVAESRTRVLMIRGRPNFETMFLQRALSGLEDFEIEIADPNTGDDLSAKVARADVLLLIGSPNSGAQAGFRERLKRAYAQRPLPEWIWPTSFDDANFLKELSVENPFALASAAPFAQAQALPLGFYAELDPDAETAESALWTDLPPLSPPNYSVKVTAQALTLINLMDAETGATLGPALLAWDRNGRRFAATFGSGYWKWGFLTIGTGGSDELYMNFLKRVLRWLATAPGNRSVQVTPDRRLYSAGETVHFDARVLGGDGRPISSARMEVLLQGPTLSKVILEPDALGRYRGDFTPEAIGSYTYEGLAIWESDTLGADSGSIVVESYNVEKETLSQNRALLEEISNASGGSYVPADSIAKLAQIIPVPPRYKVIEWSRRFFLNWDILGIIVGLLALEWIMRKRRGML